MPTPDEFAKRVRAMADLVGGNSTRLVRRVALAADTTVVLATPVDTGRARANWQIGINGPTNGVKYPSPASPGSPESGAIEALQEAASKIPAFNGEGTIHITNNLPYIKRLNEGYSKQAPAAFVEIAVQAARKAIDTAGQIHTNVVTEKI
jgi:hypothetical protein